MKRYKVIFLWKKSTLYVKQSYQGFRLNLGKRYEMIILRLSLTTFEASNIFLWGAAGLVAKIG